MANEDSLQELQNSIQQVLEAETNDLLALARITGLDISTDFAGADLSNANLRGADLRGADLRGVNLSGANLRGSQFITANLSGAKLIRANLSGADLRNANLSGAKLIRANLSGAYLIRADLSGADLRGAFGMDVRRAQARGEHILHRGLDPVGGLGLVQ